MRVLLYDLETAPNVSRTWGVYEQNVIEVEQDWYLLCFAYKWAHEKEARTIGLPDFPLYKTDPTNDREVVKALWKLFDEADVLIAHNGDKFDYRKSRTRFIVHGLKPHSPIKNIDTKKLAKRFFGFDSNKLDEVARQLGLGRKAQTGGYDLWRGCMSGDPKAWKKMRLYNKQDVIVLEEVWRALSAWTEGQPNRNVYEDVPRETCPRPSCGAAMSKNGTRVYGLKLWQQLLCSRCGGYGKSPLGERGVVR